MIENMITQNAEVIVEVGLHFLWQATAIAVLSWTICRLLFKSPRVRSAFYSISLVAMIFSVPITLSVVSGNDPLVSQADDPVIRETGGFVPDGEILSSETGSTAVQPD